ncbi:MAG: penicillin acylase family protein [Leptospiraceae bacterium]|nr:penicillin acylase family protein [Leptospiraceae bacterium]
MRRFLRATPRQWALIITTFIITIGLVISLEVWYRARLGLGQTEGTVKLTHLQSRVRIARDSFGIPFIEAQNQSDLFLAAGYATAQDRLWQITILKMAGSGRLSEMLGPKLLESDIYMRSVGLLQGARKSLALMSPAERHLLGQYARGINLYIKHNRTPIEFVLAGVQSEDWQPVDSLTAFAMANYDLSNNLRPELSYLKLAARLGWRKAAILTPTQPDEPLPVALTTKLNGIQASEMDQIATQAASVLQAGDRLALAVNPARHAEPNPVPASNNWAVAGRRTSGGKSIVANDTHLLISIPSFWMIMHLKAPGYDAAGVMIPGVPLIGLGFNGSVAWGATMMMADSQDLYLEKLRSNGEQLEYLYKGEWRLAGKRIESFKVKGAAEPLEVPVYSTIHGPLLNGALERESAIRGLRPQRLQTKWGLALRWSMQDGERGVSGLLALGRARTIAQARAALSRIDSMYLNIVYGTADQIAWQTTGRIPIRPKGKGLFPSPGWTGAYDWQGYLAFDKKPYEIDPRRGWLATANHRSVPTETSPPITASFVGPWRYRRAKEMLEARPLSDFDYMQTMQRDQTSLYARDLFKEIYSSGMQAELQKAASRLSADQRTAFQSSLEYLKNFDARMVADSSPAALVGAFYYQFSRAVFLDEEVFASNPDLYFQTQYGYTAGMDHLLVNRPSPFYDDVTTPDYLETRPDMIARSLALAWQYCQSELGTNPADWRWGDLHQYYWKHQLSYGLAALGYWLDMGPQAAGGDRSTLNVSGFNWGQSFQTTWIPAMRLIVDFSQPDPAWLVTHTGQSGNPASPHYRDMQASFLQVTPHPLSFQPERMRAQYTSVLELQPE